MSELIDAMPGVGPTATPGILQYYAATQRPGLGQFLGAEFGEGWWSSAAGQATAWARAKSTPDRDPLTEEQWKASPDFRPQVDFREGMTAGEARTRADIVDENRYRRGLIERRQPGFWGSVAGFGASLAGASLSPESLLPFGEAMDVAKAGLAARMLAGARVGAMQTAALALPISASQSQFGDDVTAADILLNIGAGAVLGAGLGGLGHVAASRLRAGEPLPRDVPMPTANVIHEAADVTQTIAEQISLGEDVNIGQHQIADTIDRMRAETNARLNPPDPLYDAAVESAMSKANPSAARLASELQLEPRMAEALMRRMENEGLVSQENSVGDRMRLMSPEQLQARAAAREAVGPVAREAPIFGGERAPLDAETAAIVQRVREQFPPREPALARAQPLLPLDRRPLPPKTMPGGERPPLTAKDVDESLEAAIIDSKLQQLKDSGRLDEAAVKAVDNAALVAQRAANYEPAAQRAILCAMGG